MPRTKIPRNTIVDVLIEAGYRCAVPTCRNILAIDLHHIVEVKDGGPNEASNLLALCPTCHALYTRGTISKEAIDAWKTMLVALTQAFDKESISNLLFLYKAEQIFYEKLKKMQNDKDKIKREIVNGLYRESVSYPRAVSDLNLLIFSGDGVLKFSHLIASDLASYHVAIEEGTTILYRVFLTQKGERIVKAWFSGNRTEVKEALANLT